MKRKKITCAALIGCLWATVAIVSCTKNLATTNPNVLSLDTYFKTANELAGGTNSIYAAWHGGNLLGREWFFLHDMRSDDVVSGGGQLELARAQVVNGGVTPANSVMLAVWDGLYAVIHRANTVTDHAAGVTDNTALRDRLVGEAKLLRAWAYFDLVSQWGSVPLYTTTVKSFTDYQPRAKVADIYNFILKDLSDAAAVLPGKSAYGPNDQGRVTAAFANAMLARVDIQLGDYAGAKAALLKIPTSGADGYQLTDRYLDNFEEETEFNKESIFEMIYVDKGDNNFNWGGNGVGDGTNADQTTVRNQEYNPVAWRNLIPSNHVLNEFESTKTGALKNDPRLSYTVYRTGDSINSLAGPAQVLVAGDQNGNSSVIHGDTVKAGWRKFMLIYKETKSFAGFHPGSNNQRVVRYAEVLLMLAECENELGNTASAVGYLNQLRARPSVAMPLYPTNQYPVSSKDQVTQAIIHEKTVEMADEEVRNIDILRWRKKGYFKTEPLSYFKAGRDELLPIPQSELDNNPKLSAAGVPAQNPGY